MERWRQDLYHHGILGMRWGKRNGPPYPLDEGDHSQSEKKAGWKQSLKENRQTIKTVGKVAAIAALAGIAGYTVYKSGALNSFAEIGKGYVGDIKLDDTIKIDVASTAKQVADKIKPIPKCCNFNSFVGALANEHDISLKADAGDKYVGKINDLMQKALKYPDDRVIPMTNPDIFTDYDRLSNAILRVAKQKDGAFGTIGCDVKRGGGHVFNWKIVDGIVKLYDTAADNGTTYSAVEDASIYTKLLSGNNGIITRLDGLTANDLNMDFLKEICNIG